MIPSPDMIAIYLLRQDTELAKLHSGRVSTDMPAKRPCLRVTLMPGSDPGDYYEWRATIQVDCFADDQVMAADLAAAVRYRWTSYVGTDVPSLGGYVAGQWVQSDPMWVSTPGSEMPRYTLMLGIAVFESPS